MKKILAYTVFCFALITCKNHAQAQIGEVQMRIGYNTAMPTGAFKDFMEKNSFRGYFGEVTYGISDQLRVGIGVQNNDYYQKFPRQVYETHDGTISAVVTNSIQTTPLLLKANYELTKKSLCASVCWIGSGI